MSSLPDGVFGDFGGLLSLYVPQDIYMSVYIYECTAVSPVYIYIYVCTDFSLCLYADVYICMCVFVYMCLYMCMYCLLFVCTAAAIYAYVCVDFFLTST